MQRIATTAVAPWSRMRAGGVCREGSSPRLHLGCGATRLDGWVNVDRVGSRADLYWDLGRPLPFPAGSASAVFLEHVLEHFELSDAARLVRDCRRVLAPGGVIRVGVPDFGRYARSYAGDQSWIAAVRPGRPTPFLAMAEVANRHGHRSIWDAETLVHLLVDAGFRDVAERAFSDSAIVPPPDSAARAPETLYVEARVETTR